MTTVATAVQKVWGLQSAPDLTPPFCLTLACLIIYITRAVFVGRVVTPCMWNNFRGSGNIAFFKIESVFYNEMKEFIPRVAVIYSHQVINLLIGAPSWIDFLFSWESDCCAKVLGGRQMKKSQKQKKCRKLEGRQMMLKIKLHLFDNLVHCF